MTDEKLLGWGYRQIGWLLDEVESAGAVIPEKYRSVDHERFDIEAVREQDAVRLARLSAGQLISFAFTSSAMHPNVASDAVARQRLIRAGRIEGQIRRAISSLREDETMLALLSARMLADPDSGGGIHGVIAGMDRAVLALQSLSSELPEAAPIKGTIPTKQQLLFQELASAYQEIIGAEPRDGYSCNYHDPQGPFVAFVKAAFQLADAAPMKQAALEGAIKSAGIMVASEEI